MKKSDSLTRKIYRKSTVDKIERKVKLLGLSSQVDVDYFLRTRLILCLLLTFVPIFLPYGIFYGPLFAIIIWYIYEYLEFDLKIKKRASYLDEQAILFFEVLLMTLNSSRNLENSLKITASNLKSELALEFRKSLSELDLGKTLDEVLISLKERIPSLIVNNIILNITQANTFGTSVEDSLKTQINYLKEKRILEIKSSLNKIPFKISLVSVIFLVPITLMILLMPFILEENNYNNRDKISSVNNVKK